MFSKGSFQFTSIPFQEKYFLTWTTELHSVICFMEKTILRLKFYPKLQKKSILFYIGIFSEDLQKLRKCQNVRKRGAQILFGQCPNAK